MNSDKPNMMHADLGRSTLTLRLQSILSIVVVFVLTASACVSGQPDYDAIEDDTGVADTGDDTSNTDEGADAAVPVTEEPDTPVTEEPDTPVVDDTPPDNCDDRRWYVDNDNDGHGDPDLPPVNGGCEAPPGHAPLEDDCNDANNAVYAGAQEIPADGIDQDCDGFEQCFVDADDDGVLPDSPTTSPSASLGCGAPGLLGADAPRGDCDDNNPLISPNTLENCDGVDQNCDGVIDDGDVCPCPVRQRDNGEAYLFCNRSDSWNQARNFCDDLGYQLVTIDSAEANTWILQQAQQLNLDEIWLGLNDREQERTFVWVDGSAPTFTGWNNNQPSHGNDQDCAELHGRDDWAGTWNDERCGNDQDFVCQSQ